MLVAIAVSRGLDCARLVGRRRDLVVRSPATIHASGHSFCCAPRLPCRADGSFRSSGSLSGGRSSLKTFLARSYRRFRRCPKPAPWPLSILPRDFFTHIRRVGCKDLTDEDLELIALSPSWRGSGWEVARDRRRAATLGPPARLRTRGLVGYQDYRCGPYSLEETRSCETWLCETRRSRTTDLHTWPRSAARLRQSGRNIGYRCGPSPPQSGTRLIVLARMDPHRDWPDPPERKQVAAVAQLAGTADH